MGIELINQMGTSPQDWNRKLAKQVEITATFNFVESLAAIAAYTATAYINSLKFYNFVPWQYIRT